MLKAAILYECDWIVRIFSTGCIMKPCRSTDPTCRSLVHPQCAQDPMAGPRQVLIILHTPRPNSRESSQMFLKAPSSMALQHPHPDKKGAPEKRSPKTKTWWPPTSVSETILPNAPARIALGNIVHLWIILVENLAMLLHKTQYCKIQEARPVAI